MTEVHCLIYSNNSISPPYVPEYEMYAQRIYLVLLVIRVIHLTIYVTYLPIFFLSVDRIIYLFQCLWITLR